MDLISDIQPFIGKEVSVLITYFSDGEFRHEIIRAILKEYDAETGYCKFEKDKTEYGKYNAMYNCIIN